MKWIFSPYIAKDVGVDEAIMYNNLLFWCTLNRKANRNQFQHKYWTYNTVDQYCALFPFWSREQIKRILKNLLSSGLIMKGRFNRMGYDKTNWYTTDIELQERSVTTNPTAETTQPIPDSKPDNKLHITVDTVREASSRNQFFIHQRNNGVC